MAKKKARKKRGPNILQIKIRKVELPPGTTARQYYAGLKKALRGGDLPEGWNVDLAWRNPHTIKGRTKDWQETDFSTAIRESRKGFATVVGKIINQHAAQLPPPPPRKRAPAPAQVPDVKAKRSAASKKGWITRRENRRIKLV